MALPEGAAASLAPFGNAEKRLKHGGVREISLFGFLPSSGVNFVPRMSETHLVPMRFPRVLVHNLKKLLSSGLIACSPQLALELMKTRAEVMGYFQTVMSKILEFCKSE